MTRIWKYIAAGLVLTAGTAYLCADEKDGKIFCAETVYKEMVKQNSNIIPLEIDTNNDGGIDYVVVMSREGKKIAEALDYNHDGIMDDFYFYSNGILEKRKVDSNFNSRIDIWVYLQDGVFIRKYERDTNHDGNIDLTKNY